MLYTAGSVLDASVSQYSLVGGPFCINLSRMALLLKHTPPPPHTPQMFYPQDLVAKWRKN